MSNGNQKALIDWALQQLATGLDVSVENILNSTERKGPAADGRKLSIHLLKDIIAIRPVSQLIPIFVPKAQNTGALYGISNNGAKLAEKAKYKALLKDIAERAKKFAGGDTAPAAPTPVVAAPRGAKLATIGAGLDLVQDACICTLFETGATAEQIAKGFSIPIETVYMAIGRLTVTDAPLVQKIRAVATKVTA